MSATTENLHHKINSLDPGKFLSGSRSMLPLFILTVLLLRCNTLTLESQWAKSVSIDGNAAEWQNRVTYLDSRQIAAGFMNDAHYLYACLISYDEAIIHQIRHGGFSISCTHPELGEDNREIRFICGRRTMPPTPSAKTASDSFPSQTEGTFESIEFTGPNHKKSSVVPFHSIDTTIVHYRLTGTRDKLILELRMALHSDTSGNSLSLGIVNDTVITLVLATAVPEGHPGGGPPPRHEGARPDNQRGSGFSSGSGPPGGGMGGPPHGNGGPPSGPPGGGRDAPEPLKVKINLYLARYPDTDTMHQSEQRN